MANWSQLMVWHLQFLYADVCLVVILVVKSVVYLLVQASDELVNESLRRWSSSERRIVILYEQQISHIDLYFS